MPYLIGKGREGNHHVSLHLLMKTYSALRHPQVAWGEEGREEVEGLAGQEGGVGDPAGGGGGRWVGGWLVF